MKKIYPLKICPWCEETPVLCMPTPMDETWLPKIMCKNSKCKVKPSTHYVPIRKSQRKDPKILKEKIEKVIERWNKGSLGFKNEGFILDY